MWNHYQDALNKASKTTNCTEGWHNALRGLFQVSHPGVWILFKGIQKDIALQKIVMVKAATEHGEKAKCKNQMLADRLETKLQTSKKLPQFTMCRNLPSAATYRAATYLVPQFTVPEISVPQFAYCRNLPPAATYRLPEFSVPQLAVAATFRSPR